MFIVRILLALFLLAVLAACQPVPSPATTPSPALNPNGVIFSAKQTERELSYIAPQAIGAWTPTAAEVAKLEAALPAFLQNAKNDWLRPDPPIWEREPDTMRQYLGIVEDGAEVIYANFFCNAHDDDWHNELVMVMDGGDCYFQVKYDPGTDKFFDFSVNGES